MSMKYNKKRHLIDLLLDQQDQANKSPINNNNRTFPKINQNKSSLHKSKKSKIIETSIIQNKEFGEFNKLREKIL